MTMNGRKFKFRRIQFPLVLAYAIISHSAQGITKERVIIDCMFKPPMMTLTLGNQIIRDGNFNYIKCIIINFIECILFFNEMLFILTVVLYIAPANGQEPFEP